MANPSTRSKNSYTAIQRDIRDVLASISRTRSGTLLPRRQASLSTSTESTQAPVTETYKSFTGQQSSNERNNNDTECDAADKQLENAYARDLFFRHTNITSEVAKLLPERSEATRKHFAAKQYEEYVLQPKQRIRKYLHGVRFNTRFQEGLFRMALKMPIASAREQATHRKRLTEAGITKLCFVDMTIDNRVLEYQRTLVETLQARFTNWSAKLDKLPTYLTMYQRQREADDHNFLSRLKHRSSLKGSYVLRIPHLLNALVYESRLPSEKRSNLLWRKLRFDSDTHNQKYQTGSYSRFQYDVEIGPDEYIMHSPPRTAPREEDRDNASTVQLTEVSSVNNNLPLASLTEPQATSSQHAQTITTPATSLLIPNETWERDIVISASGTVTSGASKDNAQNPTHEPPVPGSSSSRAKTLRKDHILRASCPIRAARISYESQGTSTSNTTTEGSNLSIAFVAVAKGTQFCQPLAVEQQERKPLASQDFDPIITSTQDQSQRAERQAANITQDPLRLTQQRGSTIRTFQAITPCVSSSTNLEEIEVVRQDVNTPTLSQASSDIPVFQPESATLSDTKPPPGVSEEALLVNSIKSEAFSPSPMQRDSSGYEAYVEALPNQTDVIVIDDDVEDNLTAGLESSLNPIIERVAGLLEQMEESTTTPQGATVLFSGEPEPNTSGEVGNEE